MDTRDDFAAWERELRAADDRVHQRRAREERVREERESWTGMAVTALFLVAGCTLMIILGQRALGVTALSISVIIMAFWRLGL